MAFEKVVLRLVAGAGIAAVTAGLLSFLFGLYLPMLFAPSSNIAPIAAFFVAPVGFVFGGFVGVIATTTFREPARACLGGGLLGIALVLGLSLAAQEWPTVVSLVASMVVFGISSLFASIATRDRKQKK